MEQPKIPCASRLRPPHTMVPMPKSKARVLQPLAQNKAQEDPIKQLPPRRMLSRRSNSFSDLRPQKTTEFPTRDRFTNKASTAKPLVKATSSTNLAGPSTSKFGSVLKPAPETIESKPATTASRPAVKRPAAAGADEAAKPMVARPAKIPPYDYKARFNFLNEKHTALLQTHRDTKQTIANLEKDVEAYNLLKVEHEQLQHEHEILKSENAQNLASLSNLAEINSKLERKVVQQQQQQQQQQQSHEERRRIMHNQIQDLKGTVRVFCRVRPSKPQEYEKLHCHISCVDETSLEINKCTESISSSSGKAMDLKQEFTFDKVFPPEASQAEVFEELSQLVQSALDGYHVCVFAYGQTGSGKTYTMQGEDDDTRSGMIPRTVHLIFNLIANLQKIGWAYEIEVSFLEIYNEAVRDLLDPDNKEHHDILCDEGNGMSVTNSTRNVGCSVELIELMVAANKNRAISTTNYNEHSSRSHAVTKITLTGIHKEMAVTYVGSLSLVDLAGSETININKSLSTLGTVMAALHNKENHIPYDNSKLTYLLQSCLGGNCKTLMFVNIAPFEECYGESVNALRFAAKVKEVKIG